MARLVELRHPFPPNLSIEVGDVVNCGASGGRVEPDRSVLEPLGPFVPAVLGSNGRVLSPETPPTTMLFRAVAQGSARLLLVPSTGWNDGGTSKIEVTVE